MSETVINNEDLVNNNNYIVPTASEVHAHVEQKPTPLKSHPKLISTNNTIYKPLESQTPQGFVSYNRSSSGNFDSCIGKLCVSSTLMPPSSLYYDAHSDMHTSMMSTDSYYDCSDACQGNETPSIESTVFTPKEALLQMKDREINHNNHSLVINQPMGIYNNIAQHSTEHESLNRFESLNSKLESNRNFDTHNKLLNTDGNEPLWSSTIQHSEEYLDDTPSDFNQYMMTILDYEDPSLDYQFVNDANTLSNFDNSDALLEQLRAMGITVNRDYLTLDIDYSMSGPNSLEEQLFGLEAETEDDIEIDSAVETRIPGRFLRELPNGSSALGTQINPFRSLSISDDEVVEAYFMPDGNFKVVYDNLSKEYRSRMTPHDDHVRYLQLMDLADITGNRSNTLANVNGLNATGHTSDSNRLDKLRARLVSGIDRKLKPIILIRRKRSDHDRRLSNPPGLKDDFTNLTQRLPPKLKGLPNRFKYRIRKMLGEKTMPVYYVLNMLHCMLIFVLNYIN